ncbi:MAG: hypothetical protein IJ840_06790 [Bacteroidales bacterium]|nr:hypothetical protein [Bacteroidales bacterium]
MFKKSLALVSAVMAIAVSCHQGRQDTLRTGDLVFVGIPLDYSIENGSMDEAIASATGSPDSLNLIHVAIAEVDAEGKWIIDATVKRGVDRHPLDTFITDFTLKDGSLPVFIVKRLKDPSKAAEYVNNAKKYLGRPYDIHFATDDSELYCSELVRDSYIGPDGKYIFAAAPMNFKNPDGEFPLYWRQLFEMIGSPIPQGEDGTNPQDMSRSTALVSTTVDLASSR